MRKHAREWFFNLILLYFILFHYVKGLHRKRKERVMDNSSQLGSNMFDKEGLKLVLFKLPCPMTYCKKYI